MSSTDHIPGERQKAPVYLDVMTCRVAAFINWVSRHPQIQYLEADESDWDDSYKWWMAHIEQGVNSMFADYSFADYLEHIGADG